MMPSLPIRYRLVALTEAVVVPIIAGSTLVLIKIALNSLGPFSIIAIRYSLASAVLLPILLASGQKIAYPAWIWVRFILLGLIFYVISNGAINLGLKFIPPTTGSLMLSFVPLLVLFAEVLWLKETAGRWQYLGVLVALVGSVVYFSPGLSGGEPLGIAILLVGLAGNASLSIIGREVARSHQASTLALTAIPMALGAILLIPIAWLVEGFPRIPAATWGILILLALANTALFYGLYNHALRVLTALELSVFLNLTPFITALWSWILLQETLAPIQLIGILGTVVGVILVQWRRNVRDER